MRLYLKDSDASEITNVQFLSVVNKMKTGGAVRLSKHDVDMVLIGTMKKLLNQRVEVRKVDGTTVIWEGVITDIDYDSSLHQWNFGGPEGLAALNNVNCRYNANLGSGVITTIDDDDTPPTITDTNQTFSTGLVGSECIFTNDSADVYETQYPTANSVWVDDAPAGGGTAADSTTTVWANMAIGGVNDVRLTDTNTRGNNYYALELEYDFANHGSASECIIILKMKFQPRSEFANDGSDLPEVWLYDDDETTWQTTDGNGVTGLGTCTNWSNVEWGAATNTNIDLKVTIDSTDIGGYFDAAGLLKIQVTCGGPLTTDYIECRIARADLRYSTYYTAEANDYTIDAVSGSDLTFTDQTPYADGIRANDTFRIGQDADTVLGYCWRDGMIDWLNYETDGATGLIECMDLRGSTVGSVLRRYSELLNWEVWQEVGWNIRLGNTYDATGLSLTHADFEHYTFGVKGREIIRANSMFAVDQWENSFAGVVEGIQSLWDYFISNNTLQSQATSAQFQETNLTRHSSLKYHFRGLLDHDAGTDYSAIGLGETMTITLHTDKVVITNGVIDEISWFQQTNGHLHSEIQVII